MKKKKIYIETYGCQMNLNDSEIVSSIMKDDGYEISASPEEADLVLLNTCSVRDNAEQTIIKRMDNLRHLKKANKNLKFGILGCMAERLREKLLDKTPDVQIIVGPDEYRRLPELVNFAESGETGIAVKLSRVETYEDIQPLRTSGLSAWLSIMRGCNNFCTYCIVPYTRGRERSRNMDSIIDEVKKLEQDGFREVTLLGQNVNSFRDRESGAGFPELIDKCARSVPELRIRFVTSHPKDMSDQLIETMAAHDNICKYIHLPFQSGSNRILKAMNRGYTAEHYLGRIEKIKELMPGCSLSTDIIAGFPGENIRDHEATLDMIRKVRYDGAYMFRYSPREGTKAFKMIDDIHEEEKLRRLNEIIAVQNEISKELNTEETGRQHLVLAEGPSKRNPDEWRGRTDSNKNCIFPNPDKKIKAGDIVRVRIIRSTSATLFGEPEC